MNLLIKNIAMITALCFCLPATAQEHHARDVHDHAHRERDAPALLQASRSREQ